MALLYLIGTAIVLWLGYRWLTRAPTAGSPESPARRAAEPTGQGPAGADDAGDAWEGSFFEVEEPQPARARLRIAYVDGHGQGTERTVDVREFGPYRGDVLLIGHCHLRNATRTFLASRIRQCVDEETGELVADVPAYLRAKYEASPEASLERLRADELDVLRVLLYVGKADGQFRAAERAIVRETCAGLVNDSRVTDEMLDRVLGELQVPTLAAFRLAVGRLARKGEASRGLVVSAAERMVATQKSVAAAEAEALEYLRQRLSPP